MNDQLDDTTPPEMLWLASRYEFLGELGRGGMAVVFLARERKTGGPVAVKLVDRRYTADADAVRRFAREARMMATLQHPNIVRTLAIEEREGVAVAIVTTFVPGETLRAEIDAQGPFAFERAAQILRDVAAALAHAHAWRFVHRDVKPENIFLEAQTGRALLADFGIARSLDGDTLLTGVGFSLGTPTYMSPEQIAGLRVDERTDVYALGLVGWELLAGRRPWEGETLYSVLHKNQHEELPRLSELRPDIPAYLLTAIEGALAKKPEDRWRDAVEFLERLSPVPAALPEPPVVEAEGLDFVQGKTVRIETPSASARIREHDDADGATAPPRKAAESPNGVPSAGHEADSELVAGEAGAAPVAWDIRGDAPVAREVHAPAIRRRWPRVAAVAALAALIVAAILPGAMRARGPRHSRDPVLDSLLQAAAASAAASRDSAARADSARRALASTSRSVATGSIDTAAAAAPRTPPPARATKRRTIAARCASPANDDQRACLLARVARDDARLSREYQSLIRALRLLAGGRREPRTVQLLRADQRAWLDRRDRTCRARVRAVPGGLWGAERVPCFAEMSRARAAEMRARLRRIGRADL